MTNEISSFFKDIKNIIWLVVCVFLMVSFFFVRAKSDNFEIGYQDFLEILDSKTPIYVLDVRQPEEFEAGHLEYAKLIPLNDLASRYNELPKDKKIVAYCRSGARSRKAVEFLRSAGLTDVYSLSGGYYGLSEQKISALSDKIKAAESSFGKCSSQRAAASLGSPASCN